MISKEEFVTFINSYQEFEKSVDRFDKAITGKSYSTILFESDWYDSVGRMLDIFINSHFSEEAEDWIYYFLWEDIEDKAAYVDDVKYPLKTIDELWEFLLTDKKLYFKNV